MNFETVRNGQGNVTFHEKYGVWILAPRVAQGDDEMHSAMVLSKEVSPARFSIKLRTAEQLRPGSPNYWEVAWALISAKDEGNFYYVFLRQHGLEVGERLTFPNGDEHEEIFELPPHISAKLRLGQIQTINVDIRETGFSLAIDTFPKIIIARRIPVGRVGFYVEDAVGEFKYEESR